MQRLLFLLVASVLAQDDEPDENGWKKTTNEKGQNVQQMQVVAPTLTEADQKAGRLPDAYRCDACMAVSHQLETRLRKHKVTLKEWEYIELFEETCKEGAFPGYGIKMHDGQNALSGAGILRDETIQPGGASIQMGGETWSKRLASECKEIVFDIVGEDQTYKLRKADDFGATLCAKAKYCDADGLAAAAAGKVASADAAAREKEKKKAEKAEKKAERARKLAEGDEEEEDAEDKRIASRKKAEKKKQDEAVLKAKKEQDKRAEAKAAAEIARDEAKEAKAADKSKGSSAGKMTMKMTFSQWAENLATRDMMDGMVFDPAKVLSVKEWDRKILAIAAKISAEALEKSDL